MRHKINKIKNEKHMQLTTKQLTKTNKEIQKLDFGKKKKNFLIIFLNAPPKLEMNIVLNVKQKQEWIMSTPLRLIKSLEVAPMNIARFGGKEVLRGVNLLASKTRFESPKT